MSNSIHILCFEAHVTRRQIDLPYVHFILTINNVLLFKDYCSTLRDSLLEPTIIR